MVIIPILGKMVNPIVNHATILPEIHVADIVLSQCFFFPFLLLPKAKLIGLAGLV